MFLDDLVANLNRTIFNYPEVLQYLQGRGITEDDVKKYSLGYGRIISVPDDKSEERQRFMKESWKGHKFEDKVVFPIRDALGQVMGLIGRSVSVKGFKIFATQEAKFHGMFVGLHEALPHIYKENLAFIVEGPFDWGTLFKVLPNTVSVLTADFNEQQHYLLRMYCDRIVTVFDSDEAGRRAAQASEEKFGTMTLDLGYKDPNDCWKTLKTEFKSYVSRKLRDVPIF